MMPVSISVRYSYRDLVRLHRAIILRRWRVLLPVLSLFGLVMLPDGLVAAGVGGALFAATMTTALVLLFPFLFAWTAWRAIGHGPIRLTFDDHGVSSEDGAGASVHVPWRRPLEVIETRHALIFRFGNSMVYSFVPRRLAAPDQYAAIRQWLRPPDLAAIPAAPRTAALTSTSGQ